MRYIHNTGCGQCLVLVEKGNIGLVASPNKNEFIVVNMGSNYSGTWSNGDYYSKLDDAIKRFKERAR